MQVSWTAAHIHCSFDLWQLETEKPQLHVLIRGSPPHFLPAVTEWVSQRPGKSSSVSKWGRKMHLRAVLCLGRPRCCPSCPFSPTMSAVMLRPEACSLVEGQWPCLGSTWHTPKGQEVEGRWEGPSCQPGGAVPEPCDTWEIVLSARVRPQRGL